MAQKPADIEREIVERRRVISEKLDRLSGRVGDDLRSAKAEASDRMPLDTVDNMVHEHPFTAVAFAFGLGAVLGGLTPSASSMGHAAESMAHRGAAASAGAGGGLFAIFAQPLQEEMGRFVRQAAAGFGQDGRNGHRADSRAVDR